MSMSLANNLTMPELIEQGREKYKHIFTPLTINNITIPNRIYFAPLGIDDANVDGSMSERLEEFYVGIANGGCGLVMLSNCTVSPDSTFNIGGLRMHEQFHADSLKSTIRNVEAFGGILGLQLQHYGAQATTAHAADVLQSPSGIPSKSFQKKDPNYKVREMTLDEIHSVKEQFVKAAVMSAKAGVKYIQLQSSNGYLLHSFMSPATNKRTDQYGGSAANRIRLLKEIISEIKTQLKDTIILSARVSADDCLGDEGMQVESYKELMPLLEQAGADMVSVTVSVAETFNNLIEKTDETVTNIRAKVKQLKKYTSLPVAFAGYTSSLEMAEQLIESNTADFIGMARSLFADNDLILKSIADDEKSIHRCRWDGNCFKDKFNPALDKVYCCVNPKYKRPDYINY